MNLVRLVNIGVTALLVAGCVSSSPSELSSGELAEVLDIRAWRIPEPPQHHEWSLEVVSTLPGHPAGNLAGGAALVSIRPISDNDYAFTIKQSGARSSGTIAPCREPENSTDICDGYSLDLARHPKCVGTCSSAILGELTAMLNDSDKRWLLLVATPSLRITPSEKTRVTPLP